MIAIMKNCFTLVKLFLLTILGFAVSCTPEVKLDLSDTQLTIESAGGVRQVSINATNAWTAEVTCGADWLSVQTSEKSIVITAAPSLSPMARMGIVCVKCQGLVKEIAVTQQAATTKDQIIANVSTLDFDSTGGSQNIAVTANVAVSAASSENWLTVQKVSTQETTTTWQVKAPSYTGSDVRTATITFMGGEAPAVNVTVTQQPAAYLSAAPGTISATEEGGVFNVEVVATVDWSASCSQSWINMTPTSGQKNQKVQLSVNVSANASEDARTGRITLSGGGLTFVINITQSGKPVPPEEVTLLATWRCDDAEYVESHSPDWSTNGANDVSHGTGKGIALPEAGAPAGTQMTWVRNTSTSLILNYITATEGHYAVKSVGANDGYLFTIPGQNLTAGQVIRMDAAIAITNTAPRNWVIKFRTSESADWTIGDSATTFTTDSGATAFMRCTGERVYTKASRFQGSYTVPATVSNAKLQVFVCAADAETISGSQGSKSTVRLIPLSDADGNEEYSGPRITIK